MEENEQLFRPSHTIEGILKAHSICDDEFWGGTDPGDVSIDTEISKEIVAGNHIIEQHTQEYQGPVPPELLNVAPNESQTYDLPQNYQVDSLNKFKDLVILLRINNVTNTPATNCLSQDNQDYYNWWDQQYIACKYGAVRSP